MPLKLVLRGIIIVSHSISSYEQNKKQSLFVFLICRFPLFLKDLFFPDYLFGRNNINRNG